MSTAQKAQHPDPRRSSPRRSLAMGLAVLAVVAALALPQAAGAQPYNIYLGLSGPTHGYVRIPHSTALNPTSGFTFEAWVLLQDANGCSSIAGKNFVDAWWVGICGTTLRSYLKGQASQRNGGVIPAGQWTHIAVTFDGANRRHYINGELVATFAETGPLFTSTDELRIGSDTQWQHTPVGRIDEVRLWNVARTLSQIRDTINTPVTTALPGLVSVWPFETTFEDIIHGHNGSSQGSGLSFFTFATASPCASTSTTLCIGGSGGRFSLNARFRTGAPGTAEGVGQVVPVANSGSGLFWFFSPDNWEVMVKSLNGCGLNARYWLFTAATTNVFYRLEVFDRSAGRQKIYFNYSGPPAPAVTDTSAFATCP